MGFPHLAVQMDFVVPIPPTAKVFSVGKLKGLTSIGVDAAVWRNTVPAPYREGPGNEDLGVQSLCTTYNASGM